MGKFRLIFFLSLLVSPLLLLGACGENGNFFAFDFNSSSRLNVDGGEVGDPNVEVTGIDVDIDEINETDDGSGSDDSGDSTDNNSDDTSDDSEDTSDNGNDDGDTSDDEPVVDEEEDEEDRKDPEPVDEENCENDADCDGFDDDEDNLPGACIDMQVISQGVSSAYVNLCGDQVFSPSDFHNGDFTRTRRVNISDGCDLNVGYSLAGSPGDCLTIKLFNCSMDPVEKIYEKELCRSAGKPERN